MFAGGHPDRLGLFFTAVGHGDAGGRAFGDDIEAGGPGGGNMRSENGFVLMAPGQLGGHQLDRGRDEIAEVGMCLRRDDPVVELPRTVGRGGDQCGAHHLVPGGDAERRTHILFTSFRAEPRRSRRPVRTWGEAVHETTAVCGKRWAREQPSPMVPRSVIRTLQSRRIIGKPCFSRVTRRSPPQPGDQRPRPLASVIQP